MKPKLAFLLPILLALAVARAGAAVRYVNLVNPSPAPPYTNWASAATNIQDAIDVAADGDEIVVTNGVYQTGGRVVDGAMTNRVAVTKQLTVRSVNGPGVTVIAGYQVPSTTHGDEAVRCVYLGEGAALVGFTLTNGATRASGDYALEQTGGGASCESATAVVSNCVLIGNSANFGGGGAYQGTLNKCTLSGNSTSLDYYGGGVFGCILNNCVLIGNTAGRGGGSYGGTLNNCTLNGNSAVDEGGAAYQGTLNNCVITGNSADYGGGAASGTLNSCLISGNTANQGGGAWRGTFNNCTISSNTAARAGGVAGTLNNCIVYYNVASLIGDNYISWDAEFNYSCTTPLPVNGVGNFTDEPQLVDSSHLAETSPCRGRGNAAYAGGEDIDGQPWAFPPSIGCDEFRPITGPLFVAIHVSCTIVAAGFGVDLTPQIEGQATIIQWDFGDGTVASNQFSVTHAWATAGEHTVMLTAFNDSHPEGTTATAAVTVSAGGMDRVRYVSLDSATPVPPYDTWNTAARTIQDAVDMFCGGTIIVSNGVYNTGALVEDGTVNRVSVKGPVAIRSLNGPELTIIDGDGARCVYLRDSGAVLSGFTLTNGSAGSGGGVRCASENITVSNCVIVANAGGGAYGGTLNNCVLSGNSANSDGGGAYQGTLNNCTLTGNSAGSSGGGAFECILNNCTLSGNSANFAGGGAYQGTLNNCVLNGNSAFYGGGAFRATLNNCIIKSNSAFYGGGVYIGALNNCVLTANSAERDGGGASSVDAPFNPIRLWMTNCTVVANSAGSGGGVTHGVLYNCIVHSNVGGNGFFGGVGNFEDPPLFVGQACGNFRLQTGSPCINAGDNAFVSSTIDLDGLPRIVGSAVDIGAYEFDPQSNAPTNPVVITQTVIGADGRFRVAFNPVSVAACYILYRGTSVTQIGTPVVVEFLDACTSPVLIDPTPVVGQAMAFYRVREVAINQPLDSDGDGIDDVFELRHAPLFQPLNPADAAQDFDHDGKSNLQEYLAGGNPLSPSSPFTALAASSYGWFALKTNGNLWAFFVVLGQLQQFGGHYAALFPGGVAIGVGDDWIFLSSSGSHTLALKADGGLWAWGDNSFGQLGIGTNILNDINRVGTNTDWWIVAAGIGFSTGIKTDGTLWAWGDNQAAQLGNGTNDLGTNIPVQIGLDRDWVRVDNSKYDPFDAYALALKADGSLWSWGLSLSGALGLGANTSTNVPTQIGTNSDWRSLPASASHVVALKTDGSLWTWGGLPTRIGTDTNWLAVAAGVNLNVALKSDGTLWSWVVGESPQQVGTDNDWGSPP